MSTSGKKPLARSLGAFVGHIARAFRTDPGQDSKRITVSKTVDEQDRGDVVLRRTTIEEMEFRDRPPTGDDTEPQADDQTENRDEAEQR